MKLLWHLTAKDLRHLWLIITLFAALIAAKLIIGVLLWRHVGPFDFEWFSQMQNYAMLLAGLEGVFGFLIVPAIVQTESLVGSRAFWMTRPISGSQLLAAKALTLALVFGLLPILVTLPWWLYCDFGVVDIARAAMHTVLPNVIIVLVAWSLAALTGSFHRFLSWSAVGTGLVLFFILYQAAGKIPALTSAADPNILESRVYVSLLIGAVTTGVVIFHQYRTRRFVRSATVFGLGLALIATTVMFWPWNWSRLWLREPGTGSAEVAAVKIEEVRATIVPASTSPSTPPTTIFVQVSGSPKASLLSDAYGHFRFSEATGNAFSRSQVLFDSSLPRVAPVCEALSLPIPSIDPDYALLLAERRIPGALAAELLGRDAAQVNFISQLRLPESLAQLYRTTPPSLSLDARFTLLRLVPLAQGSWHPGTILTGSARHAKVVATDVGSREQLVLSVATRYPHPNSAIGYARVPGVLALVNRAQGNVSLSTNNGGPSTWVAGVGLSWVNLMFDPHHSWDPQSKKMIPDANWFDDAKLVFLGTEKVETFTRHFETTALAITPEPAGPMATKR